MGKKIWLSIDPRNFGTDKIVRTTCVRTYIVRPPLCLSISSTRVNFYVYIDVDNREKARARDKKHRRPICLEEKQEIF